MARQAIRRRRLRASRGAAYTETVVMLPFFIAVWTCMIYVHKAYSTKIAAMEEARRCAWMYAFEACERPPSGCTVNRGVGSDAGEAPGAIGALSGMLGGVGSTLFGSIFGQNANVRITRSVDRPRLLGGGSTSALAGNSVMCNTKRKEPQDVAREAFCGFTGLC